MIVFEGPAALSPFRHERLAARLRQHAPALALVATHFVYVLQTETGATTDPVRVGRILQAEPGESAASREHVRLYALPRIGTISPWASKAGEILRAVGVPVLRVERGIRYTLSGWRPEHAQDVALRAALYDRMTQSLLPDLAAAAALFAEHAPGPLQSIPLDLLDAANRQLGLALDPQEIEYLRQRYAALARDPTDAELMMFAQANSEHCRHKIFNAELVLDGEVQPKSLFRMIRHTHAQTPEHTLTAYSDNAAVIAGMPAARFRADPASREYRHEPVQDSAFAIKVETHNHPTAIAPFPGAATGAGGEIRDEGATGRGGKPKAGLTGFAVSHLRIPDLTQPFEHPRALNPRMSDALGIMLDAPIGAAAFNNEFGRPNLCGFFRSFELDEADGLVRGYDKPIMLAGGLGAIDRTQVEKLPLRHGDAVVVLGGPAMLIGLGGGAASSLAAGDSDAELDFASVQRDNPEMQRRCQEVIDACVGLGADNPIRSIHDVGAGGLSNAIPELLHDAHVGGVIDLDAIPRADTSLSPMQLWCNESQERYVLGIAAESLPTFLTICARERCPVAVVGSVSSKRQLVLAARNAAKAAVDIPLDLLFDNTPRMQRHCHSPAAATWPRLDTAALARDRNALFAAGLRVLAHPTVASKQFLVTIGDRSVGGLCNRDQMIGPWQLPVADVAITLADFRGYAGEAMAIGERTPLALIDAAASARMAIGEAITNLLAAPIDALDTIKLSANWMAATGHDGEDARLFAAVRAVALELCPKLDLAIPVGKDSLSMQAQWQVDGRSQRCVAPLSLIVSAFAPVADVRAQRTPLLADAGDSELWLIGLGAGKQRIGGSILAQCYEAFGGACPDLDDPARLRAFFDLIHAARGLILAYHDRSDGGAFATLCEMAFASHRGLELNLDGWGDDPFRTLFNEELGAVVQIAVEDRAAFADLVERHGLTHCAQRIGKPISAPRIEVRDGRTLLAEWSWQELFTAWWSVSDAIARRRDEPTCVDEERAVSRDVRAPGLSPQLSFAIDADIAAPYIASGVRPRVAILREQGVNGHLEMAAAFDRAGFTAVDVHMSDLLADRWQMDSFHGLAVCGGFSYGDVLGAGRGWAIGILEHAELRDRFAAWFARTDTFTLGVCNGCQMLSQLKALIPGAAHWPRFLRNRSEQYEARLAQVEILPSPSILLAGMAGSRLPVVVAHGEGRADFQDADPARAHVTLRFVDGEGRVAERYPQNPNGSPGGITGLCSDDGRVTIMMPHPERVFRSVQMSWHPPHWGEDSPWLRLFRNARAWLG